MTRPRTISDEEILQTAREVFLEKGHSATTAEIARRAGISEGTIFRRFPTKHDLFLAAIGVKGEEDWSQGLDEVVGEGTVEDNLTRTAVAMIEFFRDLVPRVMVMHNRGVGRPPAAFFHGPDSPVRRNLQRVVDYLKKEQRLGRVHIEDAELVARILSASCWNYAFHEAIEAQVFAPVEAETFAQSLVQTMWSGIAPRGGRHG